MKIKELFENKRDITISMGDLVNGKLPKQLPDVDGRFNCSGTKILTLKNCPKKVGGYFDCSATKITSLQYSPEEVGGGFFCSNTAITSLQYAPKKVKGTFNCSGTKITSLEHCPEEIGVIFYCTFSDITSLEHAPKKVGGEVYLYNTNITSLKGIGKHYLLEVNGYLDFNGCKMLKSHMLGLLKVKNLSRILFNENRKVEQIINKYLESDRNLLACQDELIENGFKEYAKL